MRPEQEAVLMEIADIWQGVLDLVEGHWVECLRRGFSEEAAEAMAVNLHASMCGTLPSPRPPTPNKEQ